MNIKLIRLNGDPVENFYQLGKAESQSFAQLESRVLKIIDGNPLIHLGENILSRAKSIWIKKEQTFFDQCVSAYAEGLGIELSNYLNFLKIFELAAHYGYFYPELRGLIPGCTSLIQKTSEGITHSRLIDFPLTGIFEQNPRIYYFNFSGHKPILNYSCEGLAPLFFHALHFSGFSLALHHKPSENYHKDGDSIFKITFESLFSSSNMQEFRKEIRKRPSFSKWGYYLLNHDGQVLAMDLDGPNFNFESYHLNESNLLIFTNISLQESKVSDHYLSFCQHRQNWLKEKLQKNKNQNSLDLLTDVKDQKIRGWTHPTATLSTLGAIHLNLSKGFIQVKDGDSALTSSDRTLELQLSDGADFTMVKSSDHSSEFEQAWKRASKAQAAFDSNDLDQAYHELHMAIALMPHKVWKEIFNFYLFTWDFKLIENKRELAAVYKKLMQLQLPDFLKDQWYFMRMRFEKKIGLLPTVKLEEISPTLQESFKDELNARSNVFNNWMKSIYPRLEILDIFSPHHH